MTNNNIQLSQEDFEYLKSIKLHIATPCYGGMCTADYAMSLIRFFRIANMIGMSVTIETLSNESLITRARNLLSYNFLENSETTHLMFIDADISFGEMDIIKLILRKKDIVGATYPTKKINWENIYRKRSEFESIQDLKKGGLNYVVNVPQYTVEKSIIMNGQISLDEGLLEVTGLGTGFVLIKREVLEKMKQYYTNDWFLYEGKQMYMFFDTAIEEETKAYLSEDYFFIRRWRKMGNFAWIDPTIGLTHSGYYPFEGGPLLNIELPSLTETINKEEEEEEEKSSDE
jgi:hypothetical protein